MEEVGDQIVSAVWTHNLATAVTTQTVVTAANKVTTANKVTVATGPRSRKLNTATRPPAPNSLTKRTAELAELAELARREEVT